VESVRLSEEKSRIGKLTANLIENGQTVILDGGSTVAAVARELAQKSLHIVTNSLPIAEGLESLRNIELTLTGGYLDPRLRVMLGPFCEQMLSAIRADAVIMGIGGITEAGLSNNNTLVVGSEQKMIEVASRVIIVADHTKFGRGGMIPVAPLTAAHTVVSDAELSPEYVTLLRDHGIEVLLA
jgi:DeoR/GlpR family transcriptional regulator of sugar metabolism